MINRMIRESSRSVIRALATSKNTCVLLSDVEVIMNQRRVLMGPRLKKIGHRWHGGKFLALHKAIQSRARREGVRRGMKF